MIESIIPGTYIDVRAEGLISAGRIATGVVGVVGTATKGEIDKPVTLAGFANAREVFGEETDDTTLVRALRLIYGNGASTVVAVRVAHGDDADAATFKLHDKDKPNDVIATLTARTEGSWGNRLAIEVKPAIVDCQLVDDNVPSDSKNPPKFTLDYTPTRSRLQLTRGKQTTKLDLVVVDPADKAKPEAGKAFLSNRDIVFAADDQPKKDDKVTVTAASFIDKANCVTLSLSAPDQPKESHSAPNVRLLAALVNKTSRLATMSVEPASGAKVPADGPGFFGTGANEVGKDGEEAADSTDYADGLEKLAEMDVNIVVLAGQTVGLGMSTTLENHLNATAAVDRERIGVIDALGEDMDGLMKDHLSSERVILVAPGALFSNGTVKKLPYSAAAVAGLISSLPVQASLTNQTVVLPGLAFPINRGQQEQLVRHNLLTIVEKDGFRIVKGVTTAGEGTPFSSIPTRRIVDYARAGVRSASNPYIGRLNNDRVRSALKATLDAFLTRMAEDEALTGYQLEVTATRAQEIAGEVSVTMTLQPVFSIEYIRVVMTLK